MMTHAFVRYRGDLIIVMGLGDVRSCCDAMMKKIFDDLSEEYRYTQEPSMAKVASQYGIVPIAVIERSENYEEIIETSIVEAQLIEK
jgi:hypothetical protein